MRGPVVLVVSLVLALTCSTGAAEADGRCIRPGDVVVARGDQALVVSRRDAGGGQSIGRFTIGCRLSDGRRFRLGGTGDLIVRSSVRVDGLFVVYDAEYLGGGADNGASIWVQHLRGRGTRRRTFSVAAENGSDPLASDLVVRGDGTSAYIGLGPNGTRGVFVCPRWGCEPGSRTPLTRVDDLDGVRRRSLETTATGVSWTKNGQRRTSPIDP